MQFQTFLGRVETSRTAKNYSEKTTTNGIFSLFDVKFLTKFLKTKNSPSQSNRKQQTEEQSVLERNQIIDETETITKVMTSNSNLKQIPLTCSGHTRPVVFLDFSDVVESGYFLISACKGEYNILSFLDQLSRSS